MIEVQMILDAGDRPVWVADCRRGLQSPVVTVHEGQSVKGSVNAARITVWDDCGGNLLSFVDPDDIPQKEIWQSLQSALDQNPEAMGAYCLETTINLYGRPLQFQSDTTGKDPAESPFIVRRVLVVRREIYELVRPYAQTQNSGIEWLLAIAAHRKGGLICIPDYGYKKRHHLTSKGALLKNSIDVKDFLTWLEAQ